MMLPEKIAIHSSGPVVKQLLKQDYHRLSIEMLDVAKPTQQVTCPRFPRHSHRRQRLLQPLESPHLHPAIR